MGTNQPQKDWKQTVTLAVVTAMGIGGVGGGLPYITELQHKLESSREVVIRLEEKLSAQEKQMEGFSKSLDERLRALQDEIRDLKKKMESRGIVNSVAYSRDSQADSGIIKSAE
jgi:uncharacterized protein HemX